MKTETEVSTRRFLERANRTLLEKRAGAHWIGRLSSSALSTATAVVALDLYLQDVGVNHGVAAGVDVDFVRGGRDWLARHQNDDGGWGDTVESPSNVSTTTLCWAALEMDEAWVGENPACLEKVRNWLTAEVGELTPDNIATVISDRYGIDRTFSVPILTLCALAGRFGDRGFAGFPALPFELASLPPQWFSWMGLPVVSYALPALIAIGQVQHRHHPTKNPFRRWIRDRLRKRTLEVLRSIQPESGGFLEATPLTSFVSMSLIGAGHAEHPVTRTAVGFLVDSVREDGSWPIDTDLCVWVSTLSVNALEKGRLEDDNLANLSEGERADLLRWLLGRQFRVLHPYTHARPGGWAWTDKPGGVPDADDSPGALLAIHALAGKDPQGRVVDPGVLESATEGAKWLLGLQNRDGGIPTFCRGWGKLPFDQSSPDLTAHTLRAWSVWRDCLPDLIRERLGTAMERGLSYLLVSQRSDGAWIPLWFGNQHEGAQENPLYGTTRVLRVLEAPEVWNPRRGEWAPAVDRAVTWLLRAQGEDGGFSGAKGLPPSIEETAWAVEGMAAVLGAREIHAGLGKEDGEDRIGDLRRGISRAASWLVRETSEGTEFPASPVGLYFAKLWYAESLYPLIFTVSALRSVRALGDSLLDEAERS